MKRYPQAVSDSAGAAPGPEGRLVERIRSGDAGAEAELVERYGEGLRYLLRRWTRDEATAEDLYQETFRLVLEKVRGGELRRPSQLKAFLRGVAKNLSTRYYQREARWVSADRETPEVTDPAPSQLSGLLCQEKSRLIWSLLGELSQDRDRQLLFRFYIAEEPKDQIRDDLGLTDLHFNRVLHRARHRFRELCAAHQLT